MRTLPSLCQCGISLKSMRLGDPKGFIRIQWCSHTHLTLRSWLQFEAKKDHVQWIMCFWLFHFWFGPYSYIRHVTSIFSSKHLSLSSNSSKFNSSPLVLSVTINIFPWALQGLDNIHVNYKEACMTKTFCLIYIHYIIVSYYSRMVLLNVRCCLL